MTRRSAAFFDRDGTLNRDDGYTYRVEHLKLMPGAAEAVKRCNDAGALVIVVTNQSGLGRGLYDVAAMHRFQDAMQAELSKSGARIDAFYFSPFHKDASVPEYRRLDHPDRKPKPGMIHRALLEWPIDKARCFVVGDREIDVEAAKAIGLPGFQCGAEGPLAATELGLAYLVATPAEDGNFAAKLRAAATRAQSWLFNDALPMWWEKGFDRATGTWHEKLNLDGSPVASARRIRVQARQTAVYAIGGTLGWSGPWREAVEAGAEVLLTRAFHNDGGTIYQLDDRGKPADMRHDLYDSAFVLYALALASGALKRGDLIARADQLIAWIDAHWRDPHGGFREGDLDPLPPRRQNPHMHLFEAFLALHNATGDAKYQKRADEMGALFRDKFFDAQRGALPEFYAMDWGDAPGDDSRIVWPGHHFEWDWLLDRWRRQGGDDLAAQRKRLWVNAEVYGVANGVTVDEVWADGAMKTPTARLWPQTERLKANLIRFEADRDPRAGEAALGAFETLMRYCETPTPGLWRDRLQPDGRFVDEPAPASSFYHVILALSELIRVSNAL